MPRVRNHLTARTAECLGVRVAGETLGSEDFSREHIEDLFQECAWNEEFIEWTGYTNLDEEHVRAVNNLGLWQAFDFYWDTPDSPLRFDAHQ